MTFSPADLIDPREGTHSRRIFWDRDIYERELERVFGRCWLFLTHESLIPEPGRYVLAKMGEDEVIVWRQEDGGVKVFLNQCRHRGARLCMTEGGKARALACPYHGWAYNSDGSLRPVPLAKEAYGRHFDPTKWGLREIARVEVLHGFVFACMDPDAPTLREYLGDGAWYFDALADVPGGIELLGPPARSVMRTNWKYPAEGFAGDVYHVGVTHASIMKAVSGRSITQTMHAGDDLGVQVATQHGHGFTVQFSRQHTLLKQLAPELEELLPDRTLEEVDPAKGAAYAKAYAGHWNATLFPNCSFLLGLNVFKVWNPLGPHEIEVLSWVISEKRLSDEARHRLKVAAHRAFGTGGVLESDDVDNFEYCNLPNRGYLTRQGTLNGQMGLGYAYEHPEFPGVCDKLMSEVALRGFYRFYRDCLEADSWKALHELGADWKATLLFGDREQDVVP